MSFSEKLISAVGAMPFTAKHDARWAYAEATRAAVRSDEPARRHFMWRLGGIALANDLMAAGGLAMSYLSANHGMAVDNPAFYVEAVGAALYGIGHGVSGVAQHVMVHKHQSLVAKLAERRDEMPPAIPKASTAYTSVPANPTMTERLVTNGGTVAAFVPVTHMIIEAALQALHN